MPLDTSPSPAGHAVLEPETVRDLYGRAAANWAEQGPTAHYTLVPSHDRELVDAWFRTGFGQVEWEDDIDNPAFTTYVAEHDGVVVGSAVGCSVGKSSLHTGLARPDHAGLLGFAAVLPGYRGLGVGRALGEAVVRQAAGAGYPRILTDWRDEPAVVADLAPAGFSPDLAAPPPGHRLLTHPRAIAGAPG